MTYFLKGFYKNETEQLNNLMAFQQQLNAGLLFGWFYDMSIFVVIFNAEVSAAFFASNCMASSNQL